VTLDAQVVLGCIGQHGLEVCSVCPVARETLDVQIFIPHIHIFFANGVGGVFLPVMATAAEVYYQRLFK